MFSSCFKLPVDIVKKPSNSPERQLCSIWDWLLGPEAKLWVQCWSRTSSFMGVGEFSMFSSSILKVSPYLFSGFCKWQGYCKGFGFSENTCHRVLDRQLAFFPWHSGWFWVGFWLALQAFYSTDCIEHQFMLHKTLPSLVAWIPWDNFYSISMFIYCHLSKFGGLHGKLLLSAGFPFSSGSLAPEVSAQVFFPVCSLAMELLVSWCFSSCSSGTGVN